MTTDDRTQRVRLLRARLLAVLLSDASATAAIVGLAVAHRSRPSGGAYAAITRVAVGSLLPGAVAVIRERRVHDGTGTGQHRVLGSVVLLVAGMVITTAGTLRLLRGSGRDAPLRSAESAVDLALLVGGNAVGVPYLALVAALHRTDHP